MESMAMLQEGSHYHTNTHLKQKVQPGNKLSGSVICARDIKQAVINY